jgi:hypothetical protein
MAAASIRMVEAAQANGARTACNEIADMVILEDLT